MTARGLWRTCAVAGIAAFACVWAFGRIPGLVACGPTGELDPIIALEFVGSPADVARLFGGEPCRSAFRAAQRAGLLLDGLGFIPAYTAFLILGTAALVRGWAKWAGVAVIAAAGISDEIEGHILGRILDALPGTPAQVELLFWLVHVKFALLAAGTLWIAVLLLAMLRLPTIVASLVIGLGAMTAGAGLLADTPPVMMTGFAIAWIALLATALIGAFRPSAFELARVARPPAPAAPSA